MLFAEKNDNGIELHLNPTEREVIYDALRHYLAYGNNEKVVVERVPDICEIMNVLEIPEYKERKNGV